MLGSGSIAFEYSFLSSTAEVVLQMRLINIHSGAPITIYVDNEGDIVLRSRFIDNLDDSIFYTFSQDMINNIASYIGKTVDVEVSFGDRLLRAECIVVGKGGKKKNYDTVTLQKKSEFMPGSRRASDRFDIQVVTNVFNYSDNQASDFKGEFICDSISADISKGGMRIIANRRLDAPNDAVFTLGFAVNPRSLFSTYSIPSRIVRTSRSVSAFSSGYDYGFKFDFSKIPETQERLFNDLLNSRLTGALRNCKH